MKKHLTRLAETLYNTPHCITSTSLESILSYIDKRNAGLNGDMEDDDEEQEPLGSVSDIDPSVGYIRIHGALTYRPVYGACGEVQGASYTGILAAAEELAAKGVKSIVMDIDSPGGQAFHCFVSAQELRALCNDKEIELISYVDGIACSAAYAYTSVSDAIVAHPDAAVGNVGVVVALRNVNKALQAAGVTTTYITSSPGKVPFDKQGEFREEFINQIQSEVSRLALQFAQHVSDYRGISVEDIVKADAKAFPAHEALELGYIDSILTPKEFAQMIAAKVKEEKGQ